ncbi:MAG TPA: hypothetical protein VNW53_04895 [Phenylobacterium sp.]|uniref:hypothetical protein n=1 Tax=Phenylobacterium sp. TaxID=1871053 RepID=UPI002B831EAD|nr:hypothetical protein [Phenylobacterium sp.]HXA38317.1 hypothetical protein [Phenylobacterium sp.]
MDQNALPTLRIKSTAAGQMRMLSVVMAMCATSAWMFARMGAWGMSLYVWVLIGLAVFATGIFAVRAAIPSTLTLDATGLTWKVSGWPARRLLWADIDRFGLVPPRPPLIDSLVGYSFRVGRAPSPNMRASWTGFDATISSGWELDPTTLVETLERYRRFADSAST